MTTTEPQLWNPAGCPVAHIQDVIPGELPAGEHMAIIDRLREASPVYVGDAAGNQYYLLTRMADIRKSYQAGQLFTNAAVTPNDPNPPYRWIPEMLDGKIHTDWRQLLTPLWSPGAVEKIKPKLRQRFAEVLDAIAAKGSCEFVSDVALLFPNVIFMDLMGLPREDADQFQAWEVTILHSERDAPGAAEAQFAAMMEVVGYFSKLIEQRRADPQADMISYVLGAKIDGEPIPTQDVLDFCLLMFMAGLDTVASQLTYNFWHLATNPQDRERLLAEPQLWPSAIEEFLRFYSFVTPSRKLSHDTEVAGCPMKAGQMVMMPLVSANRDPLEFENADKVIIDREINRHLSFGAGPHRCLGSHLAREELLTAMTMWHERIPNYRIVPGTSVPEHGGQMGITSLHLEWDV
ncbi:MAG: cytochrome P450 [Actinomycetota bacterium]|nr:cytochrome P450 [Actinomycetota bacterium]